MNQGGDGRGGYRVGATRVHHFDDARQIKTFDVESVGARSRGEPGPVPLQSAVRASAELKNGPRVRRHLPPRPYRPHEPLVTGGPAPPACPPAPRGPSGSPARVASTTGGGRAPRGPRRGPAGPEHRNEASTAHSSGPDQSCGSGGTDARTRGTPLPPRQRPRGRGGPAKRAVIRSRSDRCPLPVTAAPRESLRPTSHGCHPPPRGSGHPPTPPRCPVPRSPTRSPTRPTS